MASPEILDVLNDLLNSERSSLALRLIESDVFVSQSSARAAEIMRRMARSALRHCQQLASLIYDLGGEIGPHPANARTAHLHFQELGYVLPGLVADHENCISRYKSALPKLAASSRAVSLANRILAQHQVDLQDLQSLSAPVPPLAQSA